MSIHDTDPFADPEPDPVRRFRGRLGGTVTLWTSGTDGTDGTELGRAGLTVSSVMVANGSPGHVLALVDPMADLLAVLTTSRTCVVQQLEWGHRDLAEAFAGTAPAPGGAFRAAAFEQTSWGPLLAGASAWVGARLVADPMPVGWSMLVDCVVEHVWVGTSDEPLVHRRGRYLPPAAGR